MEQLSWNLVPQTDLILCEICGHWIFDRTGKSGERDHICPKCSIAIHLDEDGELKLVSKGNDFTDILLYMLGQKDKQISELKDQLAQLDKRVSQVEFCPPSPGLPNGGSEFQKIMDEAKEAGDYT